MAIEGVNESLILSLISEIGLEGIRKFPTSKQFVAWLRLAPNNKISGGKILSHHLPKGSSRLKIAFRNTANAIGNLKEGWLVDFFKSPGCLKIHFDLYLVIYAALLCGNFRCI